MGLIPLWLGTQGHQAGVRVAVSKAAGSQAWVGQASPCYHTSGASAVKVATILRQCMNTKMVGCASKSGRVSHNSGRLGQ